MQQGEERDEAGVRVRDKLNFILSMLAYVTLHYHPLEFPHFSSCSSACCE